MRKPVLTIFYQYDPWNATIGGIQTIIGSFIKYAPESFRLRFVGVTGDPSVRLGRWHNRSLKGRDVLFMPLFHIEDDNRRKLVPTTLRYTLALLGRNFSSDFMHFHRLEPSLAALRWRGEKTLFVHNDIHRQMIEGGKVSNKGGMLWSRVPGVYLALERRLLRHFSQILSCNSDSRDFYKAHYPDIAERVALVRNTVDGELFHPLPAEKLAAEQDALCRQLGVKSGTKLVLFAGRLHPQKDPLLLVQAFAELKRHSSGVDVHLVIAGDGELMLPLQEEINNLGIAPSVSLLGAVQQSELIRLHQSSSACVLTSRYEGLPLVVLEALACGTPVVTTRCGETPKLLSSSSGIICDERSPAAIAHALGQVLANPDQFPASSCVADAQPYQARQVIGELYGQMLNRWERRDTVVFA